MRSCISEESAVVYTGPVFKREVEDTLSAKKSRIDPSLKEWLDKVIVPAMVRLYRVGAGSETASGLVKELVQ
jgi:hypothetical protein